MENNKKNDPLKNNNKRLKYVIYTILGVILVIAIWEIISFSTNHLFLPEFFNCFGNAFRLLGDQSVLTGLGYSTLRIVISTLVSSVIGITLGIFAGYYDGLARILSPLMTVLRSFPTIALSLLLIIYVKNFSLYVVSIVMLPLIYETTLQGSRSAYSTFERDFLLEGKRHVFTNITKVILPLSVGYIFVGLFEAVGFGIKAEVMAEVFAYDSNFKGMGPLINFAYSNGDYLSLMSLVIIILLIALILDLILRFGSKKLEKKLGISVEKKSMFSL